jgi:hypothetical protein
VLRNLTFIILIFFCPWAQAGWLSNNDPLQPIGIYGLRVIDSLTVGGTATLAHAVISNGVFQGDGATLSGVVHAEVDPLWSGASNSYLRRDGQDPMTGPLSVPGLSFQTTYTTPSPVRLAGRSLDASHETATIYSNDFALTPYTNGSAFFAIAGTNWADYNATSQAVWFTSYANPWTWLFGVSNRSPYSVSDPATVTRIDFDTTPQTQQSYNDPIVQLFNGETPGHMSAFSRSAGGHMAIVLTGAWTSIRWQGRYNGGGGGPGQGVMWLDNLQVSRWTRTEVLADTFQGAEGAFSNVTCNTITMKGDGSTLWNWGVMEFWFDGTNPPAAYPYRVYGSTAVVVAATLRMMTYNAATCTVYVGSSAYTQTWTYAGGYPQTKTFAIDSGFTASWPGVVVTAAVGGSAYTIFPPLLVTYRWKP